MAYILNPGDKAPRGKSLQEIAPAITAATKLHRSVRPPESKPMKTFTLRSLSSANRVVNIGQQLIKFDANGLAQVDEAFRVEVETYCNLCQGFFSIVPELTPIRELSPLLSVADAELEKMSVSFADFIASMPEEDRFALLSLDTVTSADVLKYLKKAQLTAALDAGLASPLVKNFSVDKVLEKIDAENPATVEATLEPPPPVDMEDPLELLAAVERGVANIDEDGEVTLVAPKRPGRPKKSV
jgi:hypothetical protein